MVTLMVHVILMHTGSPTSHLDSPVPTNGGTDTTDATGHAWQSSAEPRTVTLADIIKVDPARGHGPPDPVPGKVETDGPTRATMARPLSVDTKEVPVGSSSARVITFGDASGPGNLRGARAVAVSNDSKIWVADQTKARVQVYSMEGAFLRHFPQAAPYPGKRLFDVSFDRDGQIWVLMNGYPTSADTMVKIDREEMQDVGHSSHGEGRGETGSSSPRDLTEQAPEVPPHRAEQPPSPPPRRFGSGRSLGRPPQLSGRRADGYDNLPQRQDHKHVHRNQVYAAGATHEYTPLNRNTRSTPPGPSTPRPGGTTDEDPQHSGQSHGRRADGYDNLPQTQDHKHVPHMSTRIRSRMLAAPRLAPLPRGQEEQQPPPTGAHQTQPLHMCTMGNVPPLPRCHEDQPTPTGAPPPPPPTPGGTTNPPDPTAAHTYENGDEFRQGLGPPLSRDVLGAPPGPSSPRPARGDNGPADGQADSPDQPPDNGNAEEGRSIWERLRDRCTGRQIGFIIVIIITSVIMVTLMVHVILMHTGSPTSHLDSPVPTNGGTDTADATGHAWQSSAEPRTVTLADIIKVDPARGHGPPDPVPAKVETAGPTRATMARPLSVDTKEVPVGSSSARVITFGDASGPGNLRGARAVAVSPDNEIWVADQTKARVQVYSMEGAFLRHFPQAAPYPGKEPVDVSFDREDHIWVLLNGYPTNADTMVEIDREGDLKASFDLPNDVKRGASRGMAVGLQVYVTWSDGYSGGVQAFQPDGKLLWGVGQQQGMKRPTKVATSIEGYVYVSDFSCNYIYMYTTTGQYVRKFGGPGLSGGRLNRPEGICTDSSGHVLVVDSDNHRVVVYSSRGAYVRDIAIPRRAKYPYAVGIAVGPGGQLVVINKNTIFVFPCY
ncbi:PREDICTED: uncharacterized protein LOC109466633 [Branchiostoma belcheri]|uniref:Uncharacterized protein LOC109466633 n=1 Tax=Branchiostoma belcheri TaxID=7741 RepID=A0A6P4YMJ3_BRABE|nr:PREDICTED: uncharacterized protein LOC109466633 [Branchiostoma belcheri]